MRISTDFFAFQGERLVTAIQEAIRLRTENVPNPAARIEAVVVNPVPMANAYGPAIPPQILGIMGRGKLLNDPTPP